MGCLINPLGEPKVRREIYHAARMDQANGGWMQVFRQAGILYAPSKAANAGGVAVSGLEQTQNSMRLQWSREEVDDQLRQIMGRIHEQCVKYGSNGGQIDYVKGANVGGFVKVADAMLAYGVL